MGSTERHRIAEGREAEIFAWDEAAVLKLYRGPNVGSEWEATALTAIARVGGPAPRLLGRHDEDGRTGLLIERVPGIDMLAMLERAPWTLRSLARRLATAHAELHRIPAPDELPDTTTLLRGKIGSAALPENLRDFALEHLAAMKGGDRLCHGDLHPGNVLVTSDAISVIDWPLATRGHPSADYARSALLMTIGDPPAMSRLMRVLVRIGRTWFSRAYARTYERIAPVDPEVVRHARIAHLAARVAEGIEGETETLLRFLEEARNSERG